MTFSMKRFSAILRKEMQDLKTNAQVLLMAILPLGLALFYKQMGGGKEFLAGIVIVMVLSMVTTITQATLIAEEKEKHTLRVMMLSPASPVEAILGKSLPIMVLSILLSIISLFLLDTLKGNVFLLMIIILLGVLLFIIIGTMIGLLAKNLVQVSILGTPIMMIFFAGPLLHLFVKNEIAKKILYYVPTNHIFNAITDALEGKGFSTLSGNLMNVSIWVFITFILFLFVYKKKQLD